jgi:cell wall-associated NlpC family hydrolase
MEIYICENVFVPLRSGPSHKSEMLSQVLFGERYIIIDQAGKWIKIETLFDKYHGWIDLDHLQHSVSNAGPKGSVLNRSLLCHKDDKTKLVLEPGCEIYGPDFISKTFRCGSSLYTATHEFSSSYTTAGESLADTALKFINSPYIWGGRIPSGIDCSGLTQLVYKIHGIGIPRDSWQQAETGEPISFISEARVGDLVFFDNEGLVIHASGRVRIDTIDHQGIFKPEVGGYSHRLRLIKRIN